MVNGNTCIGTDSAGNGDLSSAIERTISGTDVSSTTRLATASS